ncbi:MAG: ATP-binding protein [Bacteroidota bacterium]
MTLRGKMLATYVGLTVVGVTLVSVFSSWQIKNYLDRRTEEGLRDQVHAFGAMFDNTLVDPDSLIAEGETLRRMARALGLRLTLIGRDGVVRFDSEVPRDSLSRLENHLHRPEVQAARSGSFGMNRRHSTSVEREFLYAAMAVNRLTPAGPDTLYVRAALRYDTIVALDRQVQLIVWIIGVITLLAITLVSVQVSRRITNPILGIAGAARAIRDGDLSRRIPVRSADEIGALAAAINDMAEKLSADITQLRKLERVRSEFLGNVSHELRTPIFSLQGFLETLLDGAMDDPAVNRDFLEKAHRHAARLNALLTDLMEISSIESGEMKMSFRQILLAATLTDAVEEMKPAAAKKRIALTLDDDGCAEESVYADQARVKQVVVNLLDNAIKYTADGGHVRCFLRREHEFCAVDVADTGCGIAEEHLPRIFERFYRVDKDRSREAGGTGLGLAIAKHIVEAHGGSIRVRSREGEGSTFTFTLKRV